MSRARFRLVINQGTRGEARYRNRRGPKVLARAQVEDVAIEYGQRTFEKIKREIAGRLDYDVNKELAHMAKLLFRSVIGLDGAHNGPKGELTPYYEDGGSGRATPYNLAAIRWKPRTYRGAKAWFRRSGAALSVLANNETWWTAYGPLRIRIVKSEELAAGTRRATLATRTAEGDRLKLQVCKIFVNAMNNITPAMLSGTGGGFARMGPFDKDTRSSGLLAALGPDVANRLGGNPATVPYRATIEPFLTYFLTRQIPNAVDRRLQQGLEGRLLRGV